MSDSEKTQENVADDADSIPPKPEVEVSIPPPEKPGAIGKTGPDQQFQMFMNPMFAELEARVKESEKILDKMNDDFAKEREERIKAQQQAHIPEPLRGSGQKLEDVMRRVEDMIIYEIDEEAERQQEEVKKAKKEKGIMEIWAESHFPQPEMHDEQAEEKEDTRKKMDIRTLDEHGSAAVTAHSMGAYISCLPKDHFNKFAKKVRDDCQLWLSKMFRFDDASLFYHDQPADGLVRVIRLAMYQKYPKYLTEGFEALYSRPPVIYLSAAARPGLGEYICQQLGLPQSAICTVPCKSLLGASSKMDTDLFGKLMDDDIAAAKTPVAVIAYAGTPNIGHVDDIEKFQEICKRKNIWLHVEGDSLAMLALLNPPGDVRQAKLCDSLTINMGGWLGIPAIPYATLFKIADPSLVQAASLTPSNATQRLNCLPLWVILQSLGIETIVQRILNTCELADFLFDELVKIKSIKQFSREVKKDKAVRSITDLIHKAIDALFMFEMVSPTVVFRYVEDTSEKQNVAVAPYAVGMGIEDEDESEEEEKKKRHYYNSLNVWLAETLQAENPNVEITVVELEREGICLRFAPLESVHAMGTTKEHLEAFMRSLKTQIGILDATVLNYEKFRMVTTQQENLRIVEIAGWAGLGAVQYIPTEYLENVDEWSESACQEISNMNAELVHKLKATDSAFSLGFTDTEVGCVKFGLITEDTDIIELISLVQTTGREVEESMKYVESMSELIREGIEKASKDLELENQHKLQQEGVLRQLPMIGSVVNWWSPPPKDVMKGRTFNLVSGTIASTEETYKYKMQLQKEGEAKISPGPQRSPRSRQTSGTGSVSSQASGKSATGPVPASPTTKTAGDVKAGIVNGISDGELQEGQEPVPSANGNLRLNLENQEASS